MGRAARGDPGGGGAWWRYRGRRACGRRDDGGRGDVGRDRLEDGWGTAAAGSDGHGRGLDGDIDVRRLRGRIGLLASPRCALRVVADGGTTGWRRQSR